MALFDEHFYTHIYHGLQEDEKKTIKENIIRYQEGFDILDSTGTSLSFATIFTGPLGKAGAFMANRLFDDIKETGQERLNNKIRIIARNEESGKLIQSLYETKGDTPNIILLSELVKRHQEEIQALSKKYNKETVQKTFNNIVVNNNTSSSTDEIHYNITFLNDWVNSTETKKYDNFQEKLDIFANLSQIGSAVQCEELTKMADLALASVSLYQSFGDLSTALSSGSVVGMLNPLTSIICIGSGLFNMFRKKKFSQTSQIAQYMNIIIKQLNAINQQLQSMQKELRENFKVVFQYFDNIIDKLQMQHILSLNIYYKIEQIEKSIINLNIICEYYGKQNLLQDLYRTVYKITQGTPEYFETMGHSEFNDMFLDIFYWLENHSFDYGVNGYIYASTSGNITTNLNTPIHNRLGYLASLLNYPKAQEIVNPIIFGICADALELLIHKGMLYYGTLPMSYDKIVPIINRANLTEQFIDYSRSPIILSNLITIYNQNIDLLKENLTHWVYQSNQKYGITNFSHITILNTIDEIISATPIVTSQVQATCMNATQATVLGHLPINLSSVNGSFSPIWKICELANKLKLGYYDFKFNWSHGKPFGDWGLGIPVTIYIQIDYILNGTTYCVYTETWHNPILIKGFGQLTGQTILNHWHHDYTSGRWELQDYLKSNTYFTTIIKKACADKLYSIRQEMRDISHTIGTQVNTLCDKIQEYYVIINKLFEMNDTKLDNIQSGVWMNTRLSQLINFENTYGYNVITYCDFSKTKALEVKSEYKTSNIKTNIRNSIDKLNGLAQHVLRYQQEHKYIEDNIKLISVQRIKLLEQEKDQIIKYEEEKKQQDELMRINSIGMQVGRILTIHNIIKHLEKSGKHDEITIIKTKYEADLKESEISKFLENSQQTQMMFDSSFCNGSSMVLLEISMALQKYPETMFNIQMIGSKILNHILMSSQKTIAGTINTFLAIQ